MVVNMNDAQSIAAWYRIHPQRHGPQIAQFAKLFPQFADAIREAGDIMRKQKSEKT